MLGPTDIDTLASRIGFREIRTWWLPDAAFDLNVDQRVDWLDHPFWVRNLKHTWYGDANLDGEFNSADFVQVFAAGKYETGQSTAGPRVTGTATGCLRAATWSPPLRTEAMKSDRGRT